MSITTTPTAIDWQLRVPDADELRDFAQPVQLAFGGGFSGQELDDWLKLAEPERWLGAFARGSELVAGCVMALSLRLTVPGGEVDAAGVTGVGVRPDLRRRGALRALMERQLSDVRDRGEPLAVLWASEGSIYQRFGYGLAAWDGSLEIDTRRTAFIRPTPAEGLVRVVDEGEALSLMPPVYEVMRAQTPGALSRTEGWWKQAILADPEYSRHGAGPKFRVVYEADGRPEGYAVYRIRDDWDQLGPRSALEVKEAVTATPRSLRGLWRYLFDVDLVRTVKAQRLPLPFPLQHALAEPRALGLIVKDGLWVRLVDLPAALAARRYGAADELVLEVADDFCPWNAGRWLLAAEGEPDAAEAVATRTDREPDLILDTADLAALYLGGMRPGDLAAAGRIEERTPGALGRAEALFTSARQPWCVMLF